MALYNGLATGTDREARQVIFNRLFSTAAQDSASSQSVLTSLDQPLSFGTIDDHGESLRALAGARTRPPTDSTVDQPPVAAFQLRDLLVALSKGLHDAGGRGLSEIVDGDLQGPLAATFESLIEPATPDKAGLVQSLARRVDDHVASLVGGSDLARSAKPPFDPEDVSLRHEVRHQPTVTCFSDLLKVDIGGNGEYATYIETVTSFDKERFPGLQLPDFWETLLNPLTWRTLHSFWCSMDPVKADDTHELDQSQVDELLNSCPQPVDEVDSWLLWEKVGICGDPTLADIFPYTFLNMWRQKDVSKYDGMTEQSLSYRLRPIDRSALAIDDGQILVREYVDRIDVVTTKTVHLRGSKHQTEGQALASLACESGWADQARQIVVNAIMKAKA